ncbi:hypothetical protein LU276_05810 [Moraxella haemolytica]|uniref:hypothetical protein n=1 Tax=Moraxella haemolytica TaxID=2904119 RepID=UPI002542CB31|nr:hypothetical protein [Moraxella sp. ZY171148]WII94548.1 hypothetical protein LU276_05810 [Moraxella sp. ZY171148]
MKSWYLGIKEYMQRQKMQSDKVQQQVKILSEQYTKCTFKICRNYDIEIYLNGTDIKYIIKPFALQIPADGSTTYLVFKHKRAGVILPFYCSTGKQNTILYHGLREAVDSIRGQLDNHQRVQFCQSIL